MLADAFNRFDILTEICRRVEIISMAGCTARRETVHLLHL